MGADLKFLHRKLVSVINGLMACGTGLYFICKQQEWLSEYYPEAETLALGGAGILLANFLSLVYFRPPRSRELEGPILSQTPDGVVQVSREALVAGLRSAGEGLAEVTRLRVKVLTPAKRKTLIQAHYLAPEGVPILDVSSRLRNTLVERFLQMVRMDREGKPEVEIVFEGFYGKIRPRPETGKEGSEEAGREPEEPPFTGPRYPIDMSGDSV